MWRHSMTEIYTRFNPVRINGLRRSFHIHENMAEAIVPSLARTDQNICGIGHIRDGQEHGANDRQETMLSP